VAKLTTQDHRRDSAGLTYVYAVVSRRAGGVSVGVNLNPNQACNWRCAYCQVPGLVRGKGPAIDLALLRSELDQLLGEIVSGQFMEERVPEGMRRLNDVAFSGNGEPTSSPDFAAAVEVVREAVAAQGILGEVKLVLITNGSLIDQPQVQSALKPFAEAGGEVWFKLDRATKAGLREVNDTAMDPRDHLARLRRCAALCPTWVQTCAFARDGLPPSPTERGAYLEALAELAREGVPLRGVLLYGLARESHQPEAPRLSALPGEWLEALGEEIRGLGFEVPGFEVRVNL
jgi:wyosine [tRNA(Phe)-imidazoG37] synthetase (radical SAM superfamily)